MKPKYLVPPSTVRKVRTSNLLAVVVSVGAVAAGHLTAAGQVAVREPVPSCWRISVNEQAVPVAFGLENVKVQLPVIIKLNALPVEISIVYEVLVLAVTSVSP